MPSFILNSFISKNLKFYNLAKSNLQFRVALAVLIGLIVGVDLLGEFAVFFFVAFYLVSDGADYEGVE